MAQLPRHAHGPVRRLVPRGSRACRECTKPEDVGATRRVRRPPGSPVGGRTRGAPRRFRHAVQPNLGQGGGQAIESAYALADELAKCEGKKGVGPGRS